MPFTYPGPVPVLSGDRTASAHLAWLNKCNDMTARLAVIAAHPGFVQDPTSEVLTLNWVASNAIVPTETSPTTRNIKVSAGIGFIKLVPVILQMEALVTLDAPGSYDYWDFVGINALTNLPYVIKEYSLDTGTTPDAPDPDIATQYPPLFPVCAVYHRAGESVIETDDYSGSTNGYIVDLRPVS